MDIIKIPFVEKIGIQKNTNGKLELQYKKDIFNHLNTIHASAQFALAETSSGDFLQLLYPELVGKVVPVVRDSTMKYKKPAVKDICAYPSVTAESNKKFNEQLAKKGRALITVHVEIRDVEDTITSMGVFIWFVQNIET